MTVATPAALWVSAATVTLALTLATTSPALGVTVRAEDTPSAVNTEPPAATDAEAESAAAAEAAAAQAAETAAQAAAAQAAAEAAAAAAEETANATPPTEETPATNKYTYVPPASTRRPTTLKKEAVAQTPTPTPEPTVVEEIAPTAEPSSTPTPEPTDGTVITEVDYTTPASSGASTLAIVALSASLVLAAVLGGWALLYKLRLANRPTTSPFKRR
jgi:uncharacterized iron-regulated membrane protein